MGIETWEQDGFQERHLSCPHGNRCHYAHKLPGSTRKFWFSTQRIREMIFERSQLRRQRELEQQSQPSIVPLHSDFDSEIEDIVAANERHQQAFAEIDAIADQLSPRELLRRYQE